MRADWRGGRDSVRERRPPANCGIMLCRRPSSYMRTHRHGEPDAFRGPTGAMGDLVRGGVVGLKWSDGSWRLQIPCSTSASDRSGSDSQSRLRGCSSDGSRERARIYSSISPSSNPAPMSASIAPIMFPSPSNPSRAGLRAGESLALERREIEAWRRSAPCGTSPLAVLLCRPVEQAPVMSAGGALELQHPDVETLHVAPLIDDTSGRRVLRCASRVVLCPRLSCAHHSLPARMQQPTLKPGYQVRCPHCRRWHAVKRKARRGRPTRKHDVLRVSRRPRLRWPTRDRQPT